MRLKWNMYSTISTHRSPSSHHTTVGWWQRKRNLSMKEDNQSLNTKAKGPRGAIGESRENVYIVLVVQQQRTPQCSTTSLTNNCKTTVQHWTQSKCGWKGKKSIEPVAVKTKQYGDSVSLKDCARDFASKMEMPLLWKKTAKRTMWWSRSLQSIQVK